MKIYNSSKKGQATTWVADKLPILIIIVVFVIIILIILKQKASSILGP